MSGTIDEQVAIPGDSELIFSILDSVNNSFSDFLQFDTVVKNLRNYLQCDTVAIRLLENWLTDDFQENRFNDETIDLRGSSLKKSCAQCEFRNSLMSFCDKIFRHRPVGLNGFFTEYGSFYTGDYPQFHLQCGENTLASKRCPQGQLSSILLIPLYWEGEIIGILQYDSSEKDYFTPQVIEFMERIAESLSGVIVNNKKVHSLKRVSALFKKAQVEAKIGSWAIDRDTGVFIYGDNINELHGYNFIMKKSTVFNFLNERVEPELVSEFTHRIQNFHTNETLFFDYRGKLADGTVHNFRTIGTQVDNVIQGFTLDITEHVKDKMMLEENKAFLESIVTGLNTAIIVIDPQYNRVVETNNFAQKLYGLSGDVLKNIRGTTLLSAKYFKEAKKLGIMSNNMQSNEEGLLHKSDDTFVPVQRIIMKTSMKQKQHYVVILYDISQHKQLEQQLAHSQKMESIGSLAAGVAHEINTPIQYVGDNTYFLKEGFATLHGIVKKYHDLVKKIEDGEDYSSLLMEVKDLENEGDIDFLIDEIPVAIDQSIDGIERVSTIVQAMKKFSHPGNTEMTMNNLNEIIQNTVVVARNEWKYVSDLSTDLSPDLPEIPIHGDDISQVILNLIVNATHAISDVVNEGEKGKINIKTTYDDRFVELEISDTGAGIDPKIYNKIFNPFFTTKEVGKGTGQGLAMAYSIVTEKHQGKLSFESEIGVGTSFNIKLPRSCNG